MDFHSLARRDLQALCKKNKIPANMTNLAMAEALQALAIVEGLDDFLNQSEPSIESPEKAAEPTSAVPRTGGRTSTRRKPIQEIPQSSLALTRTRRGTKKTENGDVPETPAVPCSRKKAPMTRRKMESQFDEEAEEEQKLSETLAVRTTRRTVASVQNVHTSRRSTRTLEKQLMGMDLNEKEETSMDLDENAKEDSDDKGTDQKAVSDDVLVKTDDLEDLKEKPEQTAEVIDASDDKKDETVDAEINDENKDEGFSKMEAAVSCPIDASDILASDDLDDTPVVEVEIPEKIGEAVEPLSDIKNPTESVILESGEGAIADNKEAVVELRSEVQKQDSEDEVQSYPLTEDISTAETNFVKNADNAEVEQSSDSEQSEMEEEDLTEPRSEEDSEDENDGEVDVEMEDNASSETSDSDILVAEAAVDNMTLPSSTPVKNSPLKAPTPVKNSPFQPPTASQKMIEILDENIESLEGPEKEPLEKEVSKTSSNSIVELGNDISLRQLRKLFKTKLQISKEGKNIDEVEGKRLALQALPENCLTASEIERNNN